MSTSSTHGLEGPVGTDIAGTEIPKAYVTNNPLLDAAAGHFYAIGAFGAEVIWITMGAVWNGTQWNAHSSTTAARATRYNADGSVDWLYWTGTAGAQNITWTIQSTITTAGLFPGMPTGALTQYAGTTAPAGWLLCDGSAVSRATYGALFGIVGTTYGAGDGSSTFNVPDLRSRAPIGAGQGSGLSNRVLGSSGGEENHTLSVAEVPALTVTVTLAQKTDLSIAHTGSEAITEPAGTSNYTVTATTTGGGGSHNNMQPWVAVNYLIKT